jgi:hypothetical protein
MEGKKFNWNFNSLFEASVSDFFSDAAGEK